MSCKCHRSTKKAVCLMFGFILVIVACCLWLAEYGRVED